MVLLAVILACFLCVGCIETNVTLMTETQIDIPGLMGEEKPFETAEIFFVGDRCYRVDQQSFDFYRVF